MIKNAIVALAMVSLFSACSKDSSDDLETVKLPFTTEIGCSLSDDLNEQSDEIFKLITDNGFKNTDGKYTLSKVYEKKGVNASSVEEVKAQLAKEAKQDYTLFLDNIKNAKESSLYTNSEDILGNAKIIIDLTINGEKLSLEKNLFFPTISNQEFNITKGGETFAVSKIKFNGENKVTLVENGTERECTYSRSGNRINIDGENTVFLFMYSYKLTPMYYKDTKITGHTVYFEK